LNHLGIRQFFDVIVTSEDVVKQKPEPDIFLEAARRIGVPAQFCRAYEDTDLGMSAIRAAGMEAVDVWELLKGRAENVAAYHGCPSYVTLYGLSFGFAFHRQSVLSKLPQNMSTTTGQGSLPASDAVPAKAQSPSGFLSRFTVLKGAQRELWLVFGIKFL